jgi:glycosyltransferase involved in cell wall biosynthesis
MLLTVFTPTFNRAHTLGRVYESLVAQTSFDFEWLIVDDGSTDNTRELVEGWRREGKIAIKYVYQENGGKPSAHNRGVSEADGELFFCVDSDDYLTMGAVEAIARAWQNADEGKIGIVAYKMLHNGESVTGLADKEVTSFTLKCGYDKHGLVGDTALIYKTDAIGRFEFPRFDGEKFIPEGYLYDLLDSLGELIVLREKIYVCEYLDGGYTANMKRILYKNPQGYFTYINNRLKIDVGVKCKFLDSVRYMAMAIAHGKKKKVSGAVYPLYALLAYIPGYLLYTRDFKRYKNESEF